MFKKHLVSVIFQKKVYPKNSEQNCSRHTMDNSSSLHSNKTLLTTRPNMRTSINKINKNFKQELKLKTPSTRTINAAQKLNLEKLVFLKIRKRVFSFLWMKNCNNILIIHLQVCCCDAVKKVEQVEKVEQGTSCGSFSAGIRKILVRWTESYFQSNTKNPKTYASPAWLRNLELTVSLFNLKFKRPQTFLKKKWNTETRKTKKKTRELHTKRIDASCPKMECYRKDLTGLTASPLCCKFWSFRKRWISFKSHTSLEHWETTSQSLFLHYCKRFFPPEEVNSKWKIEKTKKTAITLFPRKDKWNSYCEGTLRVRLLHHVG